MDALHRQTAEIAEIVIVDSDSRDATRALAQHDPLCRVLPIRQEDFDHGGTRDMAARACQGELLWFLTQDAIPTDEHCLSRLIDAVAPEDVACAYARQLAGDEDDCIERLNRERNYPPESFSTSAADIERLQVRAFFLSDTCCLYKRDVYLRCGGFVHPIPTNEDMLMAATFLRAGYRTAYCAEACVLHSHRTRMRALYRRNFDIGAFMKMFGERLGGVRAEGAGLKYAVSIFGRLLKEGHPLSALRFGVICVVRLLGYREGQRYERLSEKRLLKRTQNPAFWRGYLRAQASDGQAEEK